MPTVTVGRENSADIEHFEDVELEITDVSDVVAQDISLDSSIRRRIISP